MKNKNFHEILQRKQTVSNASEKQFGITLSLLLLLLSGYLCWAQKKLPPLIITTALLSALITFLTPNLFKPLNQLWNAFGIIIAKVTNPLLLALFYFIFLTPIALAYQLFSKQRMGARSNADRSQWVLPSSDTNQSMNQQF